LAPSYETNEGNLIKLLTVKQRDTK